MKKKAFHSHGEERPMARAIVFTSIVYALLSIFATPIFGASLKKVTDTNGKESYDSAVNQNFDRVNNELENTVHITSTETIVGYKYFTNPVDFGAVTADSLGLSGNLDMNSNKITELSNGTASTDAAAFGQIPVVATQANQETGTDNTVFVSPGRQQYHPSTAKAWVVFTGTGTPTAFQSYNISSITDNGTGDYTLNFTVAFSTAAYAAVGSCAGNFSSTDYCIFVTDRVGSTGAASYRTTSALRINTGDRGSGTTFDSTRISVTIFGDQ